MAKRLFLMAMLIGAVGTAAAATAAMMMPHADRRALMRGCLSPLLAKPPATQIGINLSGPSYWTTERAFTNLALAGGWKYTVGTKVNEGTTADFTADGGFRPQPPAERAAVFLAPPWPLKPSTDIVCRYRGGGPLSVHGAVADPVSGRNMLRFRWTGTRGQLVWLTSARVDANDPLRDLDCREADAPQATRLDADLVRFTNQFAIVRFMGWQRTNANPTVTWATRTTPATQSATLADGVSVEDMVDFATASRVDPWFTLPWNADADYIERFATYVRDHLPRDRHIYVELGNEVWNQIFPMARQAVREGVERKLAPQPWTAGLLRHAQRTIEVMQIFERVFAAEPKRLVRVIATQHVNPDSAWTVLDYPGLADHVDALATAPYFGDGRLPDPPGSDLVPIFDRLGASVDTILDKAEENRIAAQCHGKRYIAYEAGQGVGGAPALVQAIQRDDRMGELYRRFLAGWQSRIGDSIVLLASSAEIRDFGWGLREYAGQPLSETPKLRAVLEMQAKLGRISAAAANAETAIPPAANSAIQPPARPARPAP